MKNNKKLLLTIVVGILILLGVGYFLYGGVETTTMGPYGNSISFNGTELKEEKNGQLIWSVKAEKISVDQVTKVVTLENVTGAFHKDGKILTVKAPKGVVSKDHGQITLSGGIEATSSTGATLRTEGLEYRSKEQLFKSTSKFIYTDVDTTLEGDVLEGDMILQQVTAKGHAKLIRK